MKRRPYRKVGRQLRELRRQRGLTQKQVAKYLGTGQRQAVQYEKGRKAIPMNVFEKLINLYGCSYGHFLNNESLDECAAKGLKMSKISDEDLQTIAFANQFVMNLDAIYRLMERRVQYE